MFNLGLKEEVGRGFRGFVIEVVNGWTLPQRVLKEDQPFFLEPYC
jgi:hypothetical protein